MEQNREMMNCFWDLANEANDKRYSAGVKLLQLLSSATANEINYSSKRLVKGLCSSREAARQGFGASLTELLIKDLVSEVEIVKLLRETTKSNGSLTKGEEKDLALGALFGCLCLIRSKKVDDADTTLFIMKSFERLVGFKDWAREPSVEAVLLLLAQIPYSSACELVFPVLKPFTLLSIDSLDAWQLSLISGLEHYMHRLKETNKSIDLSQLVSILPSKSIFGEVNFSLCTQALIEASSGFPKIHTVWSHILKSIFSSEVGRSQKLNAQQEILLKEFVGFIDKNFIISSHEKRSVAYYLLLKMVEKCPLASLSICLSKRIVRSVFQARVTAKHALHNMAQSSLKSIVSSCEDNEVKLCVASLLTQHCGGNFDQLTRTKTISSLLEDLKDEDILAYAKTLCEMFSEQFNNFGNKKADEKEEKENNEVEEDEENENNLSIRGMKESLEGLVSLSKNEKFACRPKLLLITSSVLLRITYLEKNVNKENSKSNAKKSKKKTEDAILGEVFTFVKLVDSKISSESLVKQFPDDIISFARTKLLTLVAEFGGKPLESESENHWTGEGFVRTLVDLMNEFIQSEYLIRDTEDDEDDEEEDKKKKQKKNSNEKEIKANQNLHSFNNIVEKIKEVKQLELSPKLSQSVLVFLSQSTFFTLCSGNFDADILSSLATIVLKVLKNTQEMKKKETKENVKDKKKKAKETIQNVENEEVHPQVELLDICIDFLSLSDESIKGIRDCIKKLWENISDVYEINAEVMNRIVSIITDNEGEEDEDEDEDEDEENANDKEGEESKDKKAKKELKKEDIDEESDDDESDDESESDKDDVNNSMELFDSEFTEDDLDPEYKDILQHAGTKAQDHALSAFLELKKASRKRGLMQQQKSEFLVKTRAVDILEAILTQDKIEVISFIPKFLPVILRLNSSAVANRIQEVNGFEKRLRLLIEEKICKVNVSKILQKDNSNIENAILEVIDISSSILISQISELKSTSMNCLYLICKVCMNSTEKSYHNSIKETLKNKLVELVVDFKSKRNSKVPKKFFEELFVRFTDFSVSYLFEALLDGCLNGKKQHIQILCFEIISGVLKRFKSLSETSQSLIVIQLDDFIQKLIGLAQSFVNENQGFGNGKWMKILLASLRESIICVKQKNESINAASLLECEGLIKIILNYSGDAKNGVLGSIGSMAKNISLAVIDLEKTAIKRKLNSDENSNEKNKKNKNEKVEKVEKVEKSEKSEKSEKKEKKRKA